MATSPNGWPVSPNAADLGIVPLVIGGVPFSPGVRGGKVAEVLGYVATQVHNRVEKANSIYGCWGYSFRQNVNSPGSWSNHASGTAIDYNATRHPNGSPTAANWTAAQIAEIHTILDEVGGIVRWGGDYSGTPDAMHFEIDVPPEALDGANVPASSAMGSPGAPNLDDWREIPELTLMSVSTPTLARYTDGDAWWFFRPAESGSVSIDALLSHYTDSEVEEGDANGPPVTLRIYASTATATDPFLLYTDSSHSDINGFRQQGRILANLTGGQTYLIRTTASTDFPWIRTVVRIGEMVLADAQYGPWQPPLEHVVVWNLLGGGSGTFLTGPETPDCGIVQSDSEEKRGEAFFDRKPYLPHVYDDAGLRDAVYADLQAGKFEDGSTFSDVPGNSPGTAGLNGTDQWVGGSGTLNGMGGYSFQAIEGIPFFVGDIMWSSYDAYMKLTAYTVGWEADEAQPLYPPHSSRWPVGAIGVEMDPDGEIDFVSAVVHGGSMTTAMYPTADEPTNLTLVISPPGAKSFIPSYQTWDESFPSTPPSTYKNAQVVSGDYTIENINLIKEWMPLGFMMPDDPDPDTNNQLAFAIGPAGFLPGAPYPATAPALAEDEEREYASNATLLPMTVTFKTAAYRYRFPAVTPAIPDLDWAGGSAISAEAGCHGRALYRR